MIGGAHRHRFLLDRRHGRSQERDNGDTRPGDVTCTQYGDPGGSARALAERLRKEAARLDADACRWEGSASGEVATAEALRSLPPDHVVLNDVPVPGSELNVDHVVVGPTGVWAIDTKEWTERITCSNGMLWRGGTPLHDELRSAKWLADVVGDVGNCDARAVLCVGCAPLPGTGHLVQKVLVVTRRELASHIADAKVTLSEKQIDKIVDRLRARMLPVELGTSIRRRRMARSRRRRRHGAVVIPLVKLLVIAAVAVVAVPVLMRLLEGPDENETTETVDDAATRQPRTTPAVVASSTEVPPTSVAALPPIPAPPSMPPDAVLAATFSCPGPGQGWTMTWSWPGPMLPAGQAYLYEWNSGGGWIRSGVTAAPDDGGAAPVSNVAPGTASFVRLSVVEGAPERSSAYVESAVVAPSEPC
jgi:Nuclease-related domain